MRAVATKDAEGRIVKWFGTSTDITVNKKTEDALRESEARFRNMADHAPVMIWVTEADGTCTYLSKSWYEFTGQTPETGLGFGWFNAVHPDDRKEAEEMFLASNAEHEPFSIEYRIRRRDGFYGWAIDSAQPRFSETGEFLGYIGSVLDITDRKRAEESVKSSEAHLRRVLNNLFAFVAVLKPDGTLIEVNRPPLEIGGLKFEDVLGKKFWDCYWWNYDRKIQAQLRETCEKAARGEASRYDVAVRVAGGETIIVDFMVAPMFDDNGVVTHLIPSGVDITNRKLAEEKLRQSKENFRALVEATSQAGWELHNEEEHEVLAEWWSELTGVTSAEPQKWWEAIHPDDRQKAVNAWQEAVARKSIYEVEYRVKDRFEHYRHFAVRGIPLFNEDGSFRQWIGTFTDITERKEIERALLESETRYRLVAETASDAILTINEENKILFVNPAAEQIFGYSKEEMENQDLTMLMPEDLRSVHVNGAKRYQETGEKRISWRGVEVPAIRKDGREITVEISFGEYKSEGKHIFTGIVRDITKRKETEEALRKSEEHYRLLFKDNPLPMWVYDLETLKFLAVNDAACSHYGYSRKEFLSMTIKDIRPAEDLAALFEDMRKTRRTLNQSGVWRHVKKDGSIIFAEINSHKINFNDRPARMVLANDVTERRQTEEEVRKLNESLEEKVTERTIKLEAINKELESFSYSVSHDLRAPLRAMDGFSFALLEDYHDRLDEDGKNYLNRIRLASQKMARLIDDMLKLSRVSRGEINRREINLSALVTEIIEQLQESQPKPALNLQIQENVIAFGDDHLLRIALENLLGNAWKFTSKPACGGPTGGASPPATNRRRRSSHRTGGCSSPDRPPAPCSSSGCSPV
jgi:PAS domain S-box-containing protein